MGNQLSFDRRTVLGTGLPCPYDEPNVVSEKCSSYTDTDDFTMNYTTFKKDVTDIVHRKDEQIALLEARIAAFENLDTRAITSSYFENVDGRRCSYKQVYEIVDFVLSQMKHLW